MYTRKNKLKGGVKPPLWAGPAAYLVKPTRTPFTQLPQQVAPKQQTRRPNAATNAWKLHQMRVNKTERNKKKVNADNNNYGNVWPVNTRNWTIPVGNKGENVNVHELFKKPTMTNAERKKHYAAWNAYFKSR